MDSLCTRHALCLRLELGRCQNISHWECWPSIFIEFTTYAQLFKSAPFELEQGNRIDLC
jgi:hypothetical protein